MRYHVTMSYDREPSLISKARHFVLSRLNAVNAEHVRAIYDRAVKQDVRTRNPVVVVHGIMGGRLINKDTGQMLWGGRGKAGFADQHDPEQARAIAAPIAEGVRLDDMATPARPDGTIGRLRVSTFGLSMEIRAYENILQVLGAGGFDDAACRSEMFGPGVLATCFEFDFDWRLSNAVNAVRLGEFIEKVVRFARAEQGCVGDPKVDVVAHSMGGLILRYYLRYGKQPLPADGSPPKLTWDGAMHVEHALLIGTPNGGSQMALHRLIEGLPESPAMPEFAPAMVGSMPSLYQLLPRPRHELVIDEADSKPIEDLLDVNRWDRMKWGLASPAAEPAMRKLAPGATSPAARRRIALDHLDKCLTETRRFHEAIDRPVDAPRGVAMHLFAGDGAATPLVVSARDDGTVPRVVSYTAGDGTVTRRSALMDERTSASTYPRVITPIRWDGVTFVAADHMHLTRHPTFIDNALYMLLEKPRPSCDFRETWDDDLGEFDEAHGPGPEYFRDDAS